LRSLVTRSALLACMHAQNRSLRPAAATTDGLKTGNAHARQLRLRRSRTEGGKHRTDELVERGEFDGGWAIRRGAAGNHHSNTRVRDRDHGRTSRFAKPPTNDSQFNRTHARAPRFDDDVVWRVLLIVLIHGDAAVRVAREPE
jgi:hypothetical protein